MEYGGAPTQTFSTNDVVRLTDLTYRQVDYWTRLGVLVPCVQANGSGTQRRYDDRELRVAAVLSTLADLGAPIKRVLFGLAERLRALDVWTGLLFVHPDGTYTFDAEGTGWIVDLSEFEFDSVAA